MKTFIILFFILLGTMSFGYETLIYRVIKDNKIQYEEYNIQKESSSIMIESEQDTNILDKSYSQIFWEIEDVYYNNVFKAKRNGKSIILEGIFKGKKIKKNYKINNNPWYQCTHFSLQYFCNSKKLKEQFWSISIHDMQIFEMEAIKLGIEKIKQNGSIIEAVHIRIKPKGFAGAFWHGDYWYRKHDNLYIRYEAVHGPPGTPKTIKEFVKNKAIKRIEKDIK